MKKNVINVYALESILLAILFFTLIVLKRISYLNFAIILIILALITNFTTKKKEILSIYKKQVTRLMVVFAIIYLGVFYFLGMVRFDFYESPTLFSLKTLFRFILPITIIIITTEFIRYRLLSQNIKLMFLKRKIDFSKFITFICMVLIDLIIYIGVYDLTNIDDFLTVLGFILFASISCNLFYNYVSVRYGITGLILYRMLTVLYVYIIPIIPNVYIFFRAFLRMIYPYFLYVVLERSFAVSEFVVAYTEQKKKVISVTVLVIIMGLVTMLVSCQFRFGILVIGSGSMTGTINYGDAVVFEKYTNQPLKNGQIIIFERNGIRLVHRIIDIQSVNNEIRYFTKGDANEKMDDGYVVKKDIVGLSNFRIVYIGYPTLWFRDLFR